MKRIDEKPRPYGGPRRADGAGFVTPVDAGGPGDGGDAAAEEAGGGNGAWSADHLRDGNVMRNGDGSAAFRSP